ncbi:unnamed protein product [Pylaiella littoralis]
MLRYLHYGENAQPLLSYRSDKKTKKTEMKEFPFTQTSGICIVREKKKIKEKKNQEKKNTVVVNAMRRFDSLSCVCCVCLAVCACVRHLGLVFNIIHCPCLSPDPK